METVTLPPPDQIRRRIGDCEQELRCLRRLLRMSRAIHDADEARQRRQRADEHREAADAS
jgi:hypothetical protein